VLNPEQLRAMLRDVFGFKYVDAGGGWLIFALPPAEIGVHPGEGPNWESGTRHEISFMCDDIHATVADLRARGVKIDSEIGTQSYGYTTMLHLPGGCRAMLYQPRHAIAADIKRTASKAKAKKTRKTSAARAKAPRAGRRAKTAGRRR
jgi:hypothetical protein